MLDPDLEWRLTCLRHQIRCEAAAQRVLRVLREVRDRRLEEKYRSDQPRAPKGTPIGGQWIVDPSSARQRLLRETYLVADMTPDGQVDPRTFRPANEDNSPLAQARRYLVQRTAEFLDYFVKRQQEDPEGLEDVLKVARLLDPSDLILDQVLSADQKARIAELVDRAGDRLKPYLDDVATKLETGQVDDETALFLTAGAIIGVAKYAPKAVKTQAFAKIGAVLRRITARIGLATRKRELVGVLVRRGTKITPDAVVDIRRLADGRIVWLERGNDKAELQHILGGKSADFAVRGVEESQIPELILEALQSGKIVDVVGSGSNARPVYEVLFHGSKQRLAIGLSQNGYIVTAHPY